MRCAMVEQGYEVGDCLVEMPTGRRQRACQATLHEEGDTFSRLIKSAHLSRPEHYFSIYQSGCNHSCHKCHSWEFAQQYSGTWYTTDQIAGLAHAYEQHVTVWEPRERATMFHGAALCRGCGSCVLHGQPGPLCPGLLPLDQIVLSPQGLGPARNIVAFTGGDIACRADFYARVTERIKERTSNTWVLLETNGWGLTPANLDGLASAGLDAFWLDIKAYDPVVYRRLCGADNETVLRAPAGILARGFTLEVLTLFIPGWVEGDQISAIARLIADLDPDVPFTVLAFFPAHRMRDTPPPTLAQMVEAYEAVRKAGLRQVRLGNCGVFVRNAGGWEALRERVGLEGIG
ncbi:MAG: radical SAM protein [Anaerolineae bacterium]|nr:MAG: radical SAM protein [Anaerolineae bacterium]